MGVTALMTPTSGGILPIEFFWANPSTTVFDAQSGGAVPFSTALANPSNYRLRDELHGAVAPGMDILAPAAILTNPSGLDRFRAKYANAATQTVHIGCFGDSITEGVIGSQTLTDNVYADQVSWAGQLRVLFANAFGSNPAGLITPAFAGTDTRVSTSGSPNTDATCVPTTYARRLTNAQTFTAIAPASRTADILYYAGGSSDGTLNGGFNYTVDGGASQVGLASGNNPTPGFFAKNVGVLTNASHTYVVTGASANLQVVAGVRYHDGFGVSVSRYAKAGFTVLDLLTRGYASPGSNGNIPGGTPNAVGIARVMGFYAAAFGNDLNIIAVGENDATKQQTATAANELPDVATYESYLRQMVAAQSTAGGCTLLLSTSPPQIGGQVVPTGGQPRLAYHAAMKRIASDTPNVSHLDISDVWGVSGDWASPASISAGFFANPPSVHPGVSGYGSMAAILYRVLTR